MPKISEFYGIIILMHTNDHAPPHFHALYAEDEAAIDIRYLGLLKGRLPPKQLGRVIEWAATHQAELLADWEKARQGRPLDWIDPLP